MALYSDINYIKPSIGPLVYDVNSVFQSIFTIIETKRGERVFRPTFGLRLNDYLFEPCDELTAASIFHDISGVMSLEPRVEFNRSRSSVTPVPEDKMFIIKIVFNVLGFSDVEKSLNLILRQEK